MIKKFKFRELDRIIEMAWENRTPFEAITYQFGMNEKETIEIMHQETKPTSFKIRRKRIREEPLNILLLRNLKGFRFKPYYTNLFRVTVLENQL
ncbi:TIGR03643 family protein [Pareuzebyella sediminis]|uniref:TIGR03643 family protein n=1 Tax=Pareuzebyella sediminis TaxID=2607998 RepID=UPI0011EF3366|nr:TIGR03643 family protein [Pareuzebyella sediminis]